MMSCLYTLAPGLASSACCYCEFQRGRDVRPICLPLALRWAGNPPSFNMPALSHRPCRGQDAASDGGRTRRTQVRVASSTGSTECHGPCRWMKPALGAFSSYCALLVAMPILVMPALRVRSMTFINCCKLVPLSPATTTSVSLVAFTPCRYVSSASALMT